MVNPHHIIQPIAVGQAADPPLVSGLPVIAPAVQRIAPELARGGEAVRRTAGNSSGDIVPVQFKQFRMRPGIGAVHGHIDGDVAYNADAVMVGIGF